MNNRRLSIYHLLACALVVGAAVPASCNAQGQTQIVWRAVGPLSETNKQHYAKAAVHVYNLIMGQRPAGVITGCYNANEDLTQWRLPPSVDFAFEQSGYTSQVSFFAQADAPKLRYFLNQVEQAEMEERGAQRAAQANQQWQSEKPSERKGPFHTYIRKHWDSRDVIHRAESVISKIGGLDPRRWSFVSCYYVDGGWEVWYKATVDGYVAPGFSVGLVLSDDDDMTLVRYHNSVHEWPKPRNTKASLSRKEAQELGEVYLKKHYRAQELGTLQFSTNRLEIITPNYAFTSRDQGDIGLTNTPTLAWVSVFDRKNNTLVRTPVYIFVDAATGSMLGGYE